MERKSHKSVIFEVKQAMEILQSQNVTIELKWTSGHAEIAGNKKADNVTKEAAKEAENMTEVETPLTSIDVKRAVKDSCKIKWQNRLEASQRGRHMFEVHPSVTAKKKASVSIPAQRIMTQLRAGYCYLNSYLHVDGLKESPLYTCGEPESGKHIADPEGVGGREYRPSPPPLGNYKNIGLLSISGPDLLKITKLPSQHSMAGR